MGTWKRVNDMGEAAYGVARRGRFRYRDPCRLSADARVRATSLSGLDANRGKLISGARFDWMMREKCMLGGQTPTGELQGRRRRLVHELELEAKAVGEPG